MILANSLEETKIEEGKESIGCFGSSKRKPNLRASILENIATTLFLAKRGIYLVY